MPHRQDGSHIDLTIFLARTTCPRPVHTNGMQMSTLVESIRHSEHPPFVEGRLQWRPLDRVGEATNPVVRGRVHVQIHAGTVNAVVKLLSDRGFSVESACAWLARELSLPAPEPLWVCVEPTRLGQLGDLWPYPDNKQRRCFATVHIANAQPLKLALLSGEHLATRVKLSDELLAKIAMFDTLIGNDDRHDGNLLWAPPQGVFLIDHERSMGGENMNLFSTLPRPGPNHVLRRLSELPQPRRLALRGIVRSFCADCINVARRLPVEQIATSTMLAEGIERYLAQSGDRLHEVVSEALGLPELFNIKSHDVRISPL